MLLQSATITGKKGLHRFNNGSETIEVDCTEEDYNSLHFPAAPNPYLEGYNWVNSCLVDTFNTTSGNLEDGMYADLGVYYLVKLEGFEQCFVVKDSIISNTLDESVLSEIVSSFDRIKIYGNSIG